MAPWLRYLSPTPYFPEYSGCYSVGTIDVEIPVSELQHPTSPAPNPSLNTISCRIFYPCQPATESTRPVYWVQEPQHDTVSAFAKFLGAGPSMAKWIAHMSQHLYYTTMPLTRNAKLQSSPHTSGKWPVMVFSHGLSGSRNCYSYFCGSMASHGMVVVALDHRDGSQVLANLRATEDAPASTIAYKRISHESCKETYDARDEQLKVRIWELGLLHEALLKIAKGEHVTNLDKNINKSKKEDNSQLMEMFKGTMEVEQPGSITWAGHSFGACTVAQLVKSVYYGADNILTPISTAQQPSLHRQITPRSPTILLDLWTLPLRSENTAALWSRPLPCFSPSGPGGLATLLIMSESFVKWRCNFNDSKLLLKDPHKDLNEEKRGSRAPAHIFYPLKSAHLGQSDFGLLFPNLTKYFAKADEPERTMRLNLRACVAMLSAADIPVAPMKLLELEDPKAEKGAPDHRILDRAPDAVPGWVAVHVEDDLQELPLSEMTLPAGLQTSSKTTNSVVSGGKA